MSGVVVRQWSPVYLDHHADNPRWQTRVRVDVEWSPQRPLEVLFFFHNRRGIAEWTVSRELLAEGLAGPAGLGDVVLLPTLHDPRRLELVLESPNGRAGVRIRRDSLVKFLEATWDVVPLGAEVMDVPDSDDPRWTEAARR